MPPGPALAASISPAELAVTRDVDERTERTVMAAQWSAGRPAHGSPPHVTRSARYAGLHGSTYRSHTDWRARRAKTKKSSGQSSSNWKRGKVGVGRGAARCLETHPYSPRSARALASASNAQMSTEVRSGLRQRRPSLNSIAS
jgi:hypothetical protein